MLDFSKQRVLVIGDVMHDEYWKGSCERISPEAPVPVVTVNKTIDKAGGAANVALNVNAMGAHVTLIGVVGKDRSADILRHTLQDHGVVCKFLVDAAGHTIRKLRVIEGHNIQMIRMDFEQRFAAHVQMEAQFAKEVALATIVVFSDYDKGTLCNLPRLIEIAKEQGVKVIVDPKKDDFAFYAGVDIITPNKKELCAVIDEGDIDDKAMIGGARRLMAAHDLQYTLVTLSERGMMLISQDKVHNFSSKAVDIVDVTGAGDTVVAAMACAWSDSSNLIQAVNIANTAAGIVVGKTGVSFATIEEIAHGMQDWETEKVIAREVIAAKISSIKKAGKKVVLTNGCFDLLHAGHVQYLREAKQLGDVLIVAVNTDSTVRALKGKDRPINNLFTRITVLAALEMVDYVVPFEEETPHAIISIIKPNVLVKGGDYESVDQVVGAELVHAYNGTVKVLGLVQEQSTSATIGKILHQVQK